MKTVEEYYDVVVVGAGHAGCEAALAAARLGCETIIFTVSMNSVALMPCNPNIGGSSKGHLVKEIDALGGEMGKNIDKTYIQSKMLNKSKGPAVHSLRAQADKDAYSMTMRYTLQNTDNLTLRQAEVTELIVEDGVIKGVKTFSGAIYHAKTVVLATGTYLKARCLYGEVVNYTGPNGLQAANYLSQSLKDNGVELYRFKTGTPARIDKRSVNFDVMEEQFGDEKIVPFSFTNKEEDIKREQISCWLTYTNEETHKIIRDNLDRSPIYAGVIEGTGPRYCPSIEDKVVRFAEKPRHQIFVEPCGLDTEEMYLQGMSSSLPEAVQNEMYRTIEGFEHLEIMRPAYAIEYDCADPTALAPTLEFKEIRGLYGAGQFNGTSGYEEAAAQGLLAGLNAARAVQGRPGIVLKRQESYIGTLVDDLVTKGVLDPYRMMTSRSEYRLYLRQDNADERLTPLGREIGLVDDARWAEFNHRRAVRREEAARLTKVVVRPADANPVLAEKGEPLLTSGASAAELLRRPALRYTDIARMLPENPDVTPFIAYCLETEIKYEGYIKRQQSQIGAVKRQEETPIPEDFDYAPLTGLRLEAREKLAKIRPRSVGQAARIPGVGPADVACLAVELAKRRRSEGKE